MKKLFLTFAAIVLLHGVNFAGGETTQSPLPPRGTEEAAVSPRDGITNMKLTPGERSKTIYFNDSGTVTGVSGGGDFACSYGYNSVTVTYTGSIYSYAQGSVSYWRMLPMVGQPPLTTGGTIFVTFQPDPVP